MFQINKPKIVQYLFKGNKILEFKIPRVFKTKEKKREFLDYINLETDFNE